MVAIALWTQAPFVIGPKNRARQRAREFSSQMGFRTCLCASSVNQDEHSAADCIPLVSSTFGKYALDGPPVNACKPIVPNFQMQNPAGTAALGAPPSSHARSQRRSRNWRRSSPESFPPNSLLAGSSPRRSQKGDTCLANVVGRWAHVEFRPGTPIHRTCTPSLQCH